MTGLVALAFGAGLVSVVNPCGFAVLPAWVAYHVEAASASGRVSWMVRLRSGVFTGLALAAGYLAVIAVISALIAAGAQALLAIAPQIAIVVGVLLALAGLALLFGRNVSLRLPAAVRGLAGKGLTGGRLVAFGAAYALASLGCSVGLLVAVIAEALSTASLAGALTVFGGYALGSATLLLLLTTSTAFAGGGLARVLRRGVPVLHRITGVIMLLAGAYVVAYWLPAALGGLPGRGLPDAAPVAGAVALWVSSHQLVIVTLAVLVAAVALATLVINRRRPEPSEASPAGSDAATRHQGSGECC